MFTASRTHSQIEMFINCLRILQYLQNVALLDGSVLQLAGLLLQVKSGATDRQAVHPLLWHAKCTLAGLHCIHLLLKALHVGQQMLQKHIKH